MIEQFEKTYNDYPQSATNNAKKALKWKKENGSKCGTAVGWTRANQLAKREKISRKTIARMASFKRHQKNKDVPYSEGCGGIMWDAWGGTSGVNWAIAKLKSIDKKTNDKDKKNMNRIFLKKAFKEAKASQTRGEMRDVSLLQLGEAKGHGVLVDKESLESALDAITSKIPAFLTHDGALSEDRILKQIGYFKGFYIENDRLMAEKFVALDSFQADEPEKFNRLFDIASEIPETFGISLVFSHTLVWTTKDGEEVDAMEADRPKNALNELPSVRFIEIESADFVDAPASNEKGLFFKPQNKSKMSEAEKNKFEEETDDKTLEEQEVLAEDETEEEEESVEETEAEEKDDKASYEEATLELIADLDDKVNAIAEKMEAMTEAYSQISENLISLQKISKLGLAKGIKPARFSSSKEEQISLRDKFMKLDGPELVTFLAQNRTALNKELKTK